MDLPGLMIVMFYIYLTEEIVNDLPKTEIWSLNMNTAEIIQIRPNISPDSLITKVKSSSDNSKLMIGVVENPLISESNNPDIRH